ncbi:DNA polymerase III, chi subunit [Halopseudomonas xinjiangensis]|uniref:DNA polymerase III, chi subunit n=1 Tax=Halopseudomonas xinjiangensis TaxID=487184 RepID=A0A1H1VTT1_9GAMM|nr:DNA polymerase III subunit chi [Halopseudomonas xinjiangensis]SDS88152.1 DNA polymerase III, chi subunit [Halopseudomonas xinjiangensis]
MTRIDFYLLTSDQPQTRLAYACRLAHKAWAQGHRVYLHCADPAQAEELDQLLWSFKPDAFLPHALHSEHPDEAVVCGTGDDPTPHNDLLINLAQTTPGFFSRFTRLAEIVVEHDDIRVPARERFRFYRDRGYPLKSHQIRTAG